MTVVRPASNEASARGTAGPAVRFDAALAFDIGRDEDVLLAKFDGKLAAVLIRLPGRTRSSDSRWYLESGFGPCNREGLIFDSVDQIEIWIRDRFECRDRKAV